MSTYVIGDIHGYLPTLERLLVKIKFNPNKDILWFTGDLINGGPYSLETLRFIKDLNFNNTCILGNHDITLITCAYNNNLFDTVYYNNPKLNGIKPILSAPDCHELISWLKLQPLAHFATQFNTLIVHAGVHPSWNYQKTLMLSQEVENILKTNNTDIYKNLYGNEPNNWHDNLQSWDRIRCIVNYLTRIRFCTTNGQLELDSKGNALEAPIGYMPWYQVPNRKTNNTTVIFGHWSALAGKTEHPNVIALDTGCRWGKYLTAYCLEDQKFYYIENNQK